jgi:hypothetical protein
VCVPDIRPSGVPYRKKPERQTYFVLKFAVDCRKNILTGNINYETITVVVNNLTALVAGVRKDA